MLAHKGIPYTRRDLLPVASRGLTRVLGFKGNRVPALKIDGRRVQGSHDVARELEAVKPEPPLFPADPQARAAVEEAEAWSDSFQQVPRGIIWWALKREPGSQRSFLEEAHLGIPLPVGMLIKTSGPLIYGGRRLNDCVDSTVQTHIAQIPESLDRIDAWIAEGVLGGAQPNAADFQIAPSVRLLMVFDDFRPAIESRPAGQHAQRFLPEAPGHIPPVFPAEWLAPLH